MAWQVERNRVAVPGLSGNLGVGQGLWLHHLTLEDVDLYQERDGSELRKREKKKEEEEEEKEEEE